MDRWYHTYADIVPFKTPDMGKIIGCEMRRTNLGVLAWSPLIPGFQHKSDPFFFVSLLPLGFDRCKMGWDVMKFAFPCL